jgi:hypothetical protein
MMFRILSLLCSKFRLSFFLSLVGIFDCMFVFYIENNTMSVDNFLVTLFDVPNLSFDDQL